MTQVYNRATQKERRQQLRRHMPKAEMILWSRLRGRQILGYKFRRQFSVGSYIIDFYCPELKLAIEQDRERQAYIESFGICFIRVTNNQIYQSIDDVMEYVTQTILRMMTPPRLFPDQGEREI